MDPIRLKMISLLKDPAAIDSILKKGSDRANDLAVRNMDEIKEIIGFLRV